MQGVDDDLVLPWKRPKTILQKGTEKSWKEVDQPMWSDSALRFGEQSLVCGEKPRADWLIRIQSGQKLPDGGDLEEPVEAGLLSRVVHIVHCEGVWRGQINSEMSISLKVSSGFYQRFSHQAKVLGQNTWSRSFQTQAGLWNKAGTN